MSERIRIMLVDDHATTLAGLKAVLMREPNLEIVGEAYDGQTAVNLANELLPDIVIMDVFLPQKNGIDATQQIVERNPSIKVIGFSMHPGGAVVNAMRDAGAVNCISKSDPSESLISAIHACYSNELK